MIIVKLTAESNGAYFGQTWDGDTAPDGFVAIPDEFVSLWERYRPFATITVANGAITAIDAGVFAGGIGGRHWRGLGRYR